MKRTSYISISVLQVLLAVAAYLIQDFSMKRMGMMRHVIFTNQQWQAKFPIDTIKVAVILAVVIMTTLVLYKELKNKHSRVRTYRFVETTGITFLSLVMVIIYSVDKLRAYYYICIILTIILILQYIKHIMSLKSSR